MIVSNVQYGISILPEDCMAYADGYRFAAYKLDLKTRETRIPEFFKTESEIQAFVNANPHYGNGKEVPKVKETLYERMKRYAVPAKDPVDFLERYTKSGYGIERGKDYQEARIRTAYEDLERYGYCMLPPSSSKTGEIVTWYPEELVSK